MERTYDSYWAHFKVVIPRDLKPSKEQLFSSIIVSDRGWCITYFTILLYLLISLNVSIATNKTHPRGIFLFVKDHLSDFRRNLADVL